jgi:SOS response regulatory protein OraA/RecX
VEAPPALEAALRALRHRDLSAAELDRRLAAGGYSEGEREAALTTLRRTGVVDDRRYAELRARSLADRGTGDALIRIELERAGTARELVDGSIELLEPELERAKRIVARKGEGAKTARYLAGKGFSEDTIAACDARVDFAL